MLEGLKDDKTGRETIKRGVPWLTAESILRLDVLLTKDMRVLEFGSGGSTLFFSKRCKSVDSYESDKTWYNKIFRIVESRKLENVNMTFFKKRNLQSKFSKGEYDCILIDNAVKVAKRDTILDMLMPITSKLLILDNYSSEKGFPLSSKLSVDEFMSMYSLEGYRAETYNSVFWKGGGTRIYIREDKC